MKFTKLFMVLFTSLLLLQGCKEQGTATGNPYHEGMPVNAASSVSYALLSFVCGKLNECFPDLKTDKCSAEFVRLTNIDTEIGIPKGKYKTYNDIIAADLADQLPDDENAAQSCIREIKAYSCSDPLVRSAYQPHEISPLEGVANFLPLSCSSIFH